MEYTLKCTCGEQTTTSTLDEAFKDALGHIEGETSKHVVTCTRPSHGHPGAVPVIVFIANPEKRPVMTQYTTEQEFVRVPLTRAGARK